MLAACERAVCPAPLVDVTVHYLEMTSRPEYSRPQPREDLTVIPAHRTSVRYYRYLYDAVGSPHHWLSRRKLSDQSLEKLLNDSSVELYVIYVDGTPAGFAELDCREPGAIEIVQFGLIPEYIGQGIGRWFLQWAIDIAWAHNPHRVWLHTCSLDHAAALPLYKAMGFVSYDERRIRREL